MTSGEPNFPLNSHLAAKQCLLQQETPAGKSIHRTSLQQIHKTVKLKPLSTCLEHKQILHCLSPSQAPLISHIQCFPPQHNNIRRSRVMLRGPGSVTKAR